MEFVNGRSLSDILEEGPLTFEALVKLMRRVASGLQAAHERGIIHRDVSPDNIIVPLGRRNARQDHRFRHRPFDPVGRQNHHRLRLRRQGQLCLARTGRLLRQRGHREIRHLQPRFAVVLSLTGQKLDMGGSQFQLVEKRRRVPDLGGVDMRIRPLLERMMQPDPANRPATMAEIVNWQISAP